MYEADRNEETDEKTSSFYRQFHRTHIDESVIL